MSRKHPSVQVYDLDIVILLYKELQYFERVYNALKSSHKINIIVVNNDPESTPAVNELCQGKILKLFHANKNLGFPAGCNYGASKGRAELLLFLNSDVILDDGAIDLMIEEFQDKTVGVVGAKLRFPDDVKMNGRPPGKIQHAGIEMSMTAEFLHTFIGWSNNHPKVNVRREPYAVTGACLMTKRSYFNMVGGFFPDYGLGTVEDVDLCVCMKKMGKKIIYEPSISGQHYTGASAIKGNVAYPIQQNMGIFLQRHRDKLMWSEWNVV